MYLGATLSIMEDDGIQGWCMSSDKYVKVAVENVEQELARVSQWLPSKCRTPMTVGYRPERDVSAELTSEGIQRYQEHRGIAGKANKPKSTGKKPATKKALPKKPMDKKKKAVDKWAQKSQPPKESDTKDNNAFIKTFENKKNIIGVLTTMTAQVCGPSTI